MSGASTRLPPFVLVTGNAGKQQEAERLIGHTLETIALDLPEVQSLDLRTVLEAKAEAAWAALQRPVLVDDTSLELEALAGFPGPLIKWLLTSVGAAGIHRMVASLGEVRATVRCGLLYADAERRWLAEGVVTGEIVAPEGDRGFGWDPIFRPDGASGTYAALDDATKDEIGHRGKAWRMLAARLATFSR